MTGTNRRQYFTGAELARLIKGAREGRHGHRDATLILLMARHGLRVSEAVDLEWSQVDFTRAHLHVRRLKGGTASVHPIQGDELRALRELRRQSTGAFVFASERGGPMTRFNVSKMVEGAGERAGLPYAHPHMLRHTCGHLLADAGHDTRRLQLWLGHVDIQTSARLRISSVETVTKRQNHELKQAWLRHDALQHFWRGGVRSPVPALISPTGASRLALHTSRNTNHRPSPWAAYP